jgi:hypothetical protein
VANADTAPRPVDRIGEDLPDELIQLFARQGRRVPVPVFLCSLLLAAIAWNNLGGWLPWLWLSAVTVILAIRWKVLGHLPAAKYPIQDKLLIAVLLSGVNGLVQGVSIGFAVALDTPERAVQSIVLLGLCVASVATTGGYRPAFLAFVAPTLLPLSAMWALGSAGASNRWVEYFIAALILVFGLVLLSLAKDAFRLLKESFDIRHFAGTEEFEFSYEGVMYRCNVATWHPSRGDGFAVLTVAADDAGWLVSVRFDREKQSPADPVNQTEFRIARGIFFPPPPGEG